MRFPDLQHELLKLRIERDATSRIRGYRTVAKAESTDPGMGEWFDDFFFGNIAQPLASKIAGTGVAFTGTGTGVNTTENGIGVLTGTVTALNDMSAASINNGVMNLGTHRLRMDCRICLGNAQSGVQASQIVVGFHDGLATPTVDATDGCYFRSMADGTLGWECVTAKNGVRTTSTAAAPLRTTNVVAPAPNVFQVLSIECAQDGSSVHFFIDDMWVGSHCNNATAHGDGSVAANTSIPLGAGRYTGAGFLINKAIGAGVAHNAYCDYMRLRWWRSDVR